MWCYYDIGAIDVKQRVRQRERTNREAAIVFEAETEAGCGETAAQLPRVDMQGGGDNPQRGADDRRDEEKDHSM